MLILFFACACAKLETYAVKLESGVDPVQYALNYDLEYVTSVNVPNQNWHVFSHMVRPNSKRLFLRDSAVVDHSVQHKRKRHRRPSRDLRPSRDPLYQSQWHLHGVPAAVDVDLNDVQQTGRGVVVAIVDDGLEHRHPDLHQNYNAHLSYDFNGKDADPTPNIYSNDGHGTSAAGVCCAVKNNGHCGQGVAPEASLVGIRLIAMGTYDYEEAEGLSHKSREINIYSCSWGPEDSGTHMEGPGRITLQALEQNFAQNSIYIWAGGNGGYNRDNGNYDGYANHYTTIAIGAIDYSGQQAYYSEDCACLFAVTPSNGVRGRGIVTTDLTGPQGYDRGECTRTFGGTSSAAPLASGIVALLLELRPELTNRDVMHVVAAGSTQIDAKNKDWSNGPFPHSHHYGFGLMKIPRLLQTARDHTLVPAMRTISSVVVRPSIGITQAGTNVRIPIPESMRFIEQVLCTVTFWHRVRGNVEISLTHSSSSITSILAAQRNDRHYGTTTWTYSTVRHWGTSHTPNDVWVLNLKDVGYRQSPKGTVNSVQIKILGYI